MDLQEFLKEAQSLLFSRLGVFFAFSDKQFLEAKVEGITYASLGMGCICPKDNVDEFLEASGKITQEAAKLREEKYGIEKIMQYELDAHEYCITGELEDAIRALSVHKVTESQLYEFVCKSYKWPD